MRCEEALERMLEADPAVLRRSAPTVDPDLAHHLDTCPRCRQVTRTLIGELAALDAGLDRLAGTGTRRQVGWQVWAPLAAAAALALLLVPGPGTRPPGGDLSGRPPEAPPRVAVVPPPDRGVAVLETEDPTITIIWLYEKEDS